MGGCFLKAVCKITELLERNRPRYAAESLSVYAGVAGWRGMGVEAMPVNARENQKG